MTQRSSRGNVGPWRAVAAEAAATAAASGRSAAGNGNSNNNNGLISTTPTSGSITLDNNHQNHSQNHSQYNQSENHYYSRLSSRNRSFTKSSTSSISSVAMKPTAVSSSLSPSSVPSSAGAVASAAVTRNRASSNPKRAGMATPILAANTTSSSSSMYYHQDHQYKFNNTGYTSNGSISKSAMTAAAAASLAKSTTGTITSNGTVDSSDEDEDHSTANTTPIRRSTNYKNNIITGSSNNVTSSSSNHKGEEPGSSSPATVNKLDRYGFFINDPQSKGLSDDLLNLSLVEITRKRESKWLSMFNNWDDYIHKKWKKLRSRCRKGIPDSVRGKAWFYLCAGHKQKQRNPDLFVKLDSQPGDEKINDEIRKDLNRQFPSHEMFAQENGSGQEDLYRILKAFSVIKPDIGYCQGQAPLASVLLMQMPAEDAFWCLLQICDHYVPGYFSPGLEAIQLHGQMLSSFVKKFHPPIYKLFKKQKIDPVLYMTEWFMCFFSRTLSWPCVLRVWDMFFCEGILIIFKVGIILIASVLGRSEDRVKCVSAYETLFALKNIPVKFLSEEYLIERVINMDLNEKDLQKEHKEQSLKRKKEKDRINQERSKSTSQLTTKGSTTINSTTSKSSSFRNRSRSKSDF